MWISDEIFLIIRLHGSDSSIMVQLGGGGEVGGVGVPIDFRCG